jgi:hypothetical protein
MAFRKIEDSSKKSLTKEEFEMMVRCAQDPLYFSTFVNVVHPIRGKVKFDLYPFQKSVLWEFTKNRFNIILKFRQAGITELISLYCLWLTMYHSEKKVNIISIKDTVAKKVLKKIKFMYKNLPWFLQVPIINGRRGEMGSATEIIFLNGSMIESIPTSEQAGRSESLSLLVIDEAAIVRWAEVIWASSMPTLSTGGSAIVNSTPFGIGGFFHSTWVEALNGSNGLNPIRLRWDMHPERDVEWYETMARVLGPKRTAQEIDGDFLSSGNTVFELTDIKAIEDCLSDYPIIRKRLNGQYLQFLEPQPGELYAIGADVATGRNVDYSAFTVMAKGGEEAACFKGRIPINQFGKVLGDVGERFNYALLAPETNDVGIAVTKELQDEGYPNLYHYSKILKAKHQRGKKTKRGAEIEKFPGWLTTTANRSLIIEGLETDIREDAVIIKDPFFVSEAYTFIYDLQGRPVALGKRKNKTASADLDLDGETYSDDSIFGKAITNHIRKTPDIQTVVAPE